VIGSGMVGLGLYQIVTSQYSSPTTLYLGRFPIISSGCFPKVAIGYTTLGGQRLRRLRRGAGPRRGRAGRPGRAGLQRAAVLAQGC
jgi:hypothetical protein